MATFSEADDFWCVEDVENQRWDEVTRTWVEKAGLAREVAGNRASIGRALGAQTEEASQATCCYRSRFKGIPDLYSGLRRRDPFGTEGANDWVAEVLVQATVQSRGRRDVGRSVLRRGCGPRAWTRSASGAGNPGTFARGRRAWDQDRSPRRTQAERGLHENRSTCGACALCALARAKGDLQQSRKVARGANEADQLRTGYLRATATVLPRPAPKHFQRWLVRRCSRV